jgi:hypothetical protein
MKLFECQNCAQPLYFENTHCESCGLSLGYLPNQDTVTALKPLGNGWAALAALLSMTTFMHNRGGKLRPVAAFVQ